MNGKIRSISSRLREFQSIMNEYYRFDPKNIEQLTEHAASGFNAWAEGQRNNLEAMHGKLESDMDHIRGIEKKHAELKTWLDGDNSSADNYSARVEEFNDLVQQHNVLAGDFDGQQKQYNVEVKKFNRELSERQKRVNDEIGNANDTIATFNKWFNKNKDEVFYKELNAFFTELRRLEASHNYDSTELGECLQTVRSIKDELGRYAIEKENEKPDGFLICPVKLCGAEKCYMIVDTASNMVSINRELVEALDLNDYIGETIELRLANRIKINAPQLLIPGITVFDRETEYVKGVILDEPLVGVDGCLGMSFLNR